MTLLAWITLLLARCRCTTDCRRAPGRAWLLLLSYAFYAWWSWRFLPVLVVLTLPTMRSRRVSPRPDRRPATAATPTAGSGPGSR
jgi:hypothetical protein